METAFPIVHTWYKRPKLELTDKVLQKDSSSSNNVGIKEEIEYKEQGDHNKQLYLSLGISSPSRPRCLLSLWHF